MKLALEHLSSTTDVIRNRKFSATKFNLLFAYATEHIDCSFISTEERQFISPASILPLQLLGKGQDLIFLLIFKEIQRERFPPETHSSKCFSVGFGVSMDFVNIDNIEHMSGFFSA